MSEHDDWRFNFHLAMCFIIVSTRFPSCAQLAFIRENSLIIQFSQDQTDRDTHDITVFSDMRAVPC